MSDQPNTFCTTREAARLLGVSVTTTQNWAESGLLDSWKTAGGHRRITRSSVERLLSESGSQRTTSSSIARHGKSQRLQILIIENDEGQRQEYLSLFKTWPFRPLLETARDAFEALVMIGSQCPDLLITDLNMPHIDSYDMLNALHGMPNCQAMQILIISAMPAEQIRQEGKLAQEMLILSRADAFSELETLARKLSEEKKLRPR